jgi:hypothetical protein
LALRTEGKGELLGYAVAIANVAPSELPDVSPVCACSADASRERIGVHVADAAPAWRTEQLLLLRSGDVVRLTDTDDLDWWWGVACGSVGRFPSRCVMRLDARDATRLVSEAPAEGFNRANPLVQ